jgi:two-component system, OmpR family, heavy metal sensor histidine kinase CusS
MPAEHRVRAPVSLALRITAMVGAALAGVFLVFALWIQASMAQHFKEQDLDELQAVFHSLTAALGQRPTTDDPKALQARLALAVAGHHGVFFSVHDAAGVNLFNTAPSGLDEVARSGSSSTALDAAALHIWQVGDQSFRGALLQSRGETVMVAVAIGPHVHYLARLRTGLWAGTVAACLAAVLATWLAVRWGHAPLRRISATVRGITSEQLHVRLAPEAVPVELAPWVGSFNEMLHQLEVSFDRLSHFSADIAHELRTPVTNLATQTQVALSRPRESAAYREILYSNLEELDRMGKMIGDMLFLAKADHASSSPDMETLDLCAEVRLLFEYFEALAEDLGVGMRFEGTAPTVQGNRLMLRRAVSNLLSNALRYTPKGKDLQVKLVSSSGRVRLTVENPGPPIAAEHLPKLFDRFYRVDPSRQHKGEGAGLGLAIVKAIVDAHGGQVWASSQAGLTCFGFTLPLAAQAAK